MTAKQGYVWFLPVYISKENNTAANATDNVACTAKEMQEAMNGHFSLSHGEFNCVFCYYWI